MAKLKQGKAAPKVKKSKKHPGFKAVQSRIAEKEGISKERAGEIIASSARKASGKAQRSNPRLKRVGGVKRK